MTTRRMAAMRLEVEGVNEEVPPQGGQAPQVVHVSQGEKVPIVFEGNEIIVVPLNMTNREMKEALFDLDRGLLI